MNSRIVNTLISFFLLVTQTTFSQHLVSAQHSGFIPKVLINFTGITNADYDVNYYVVTYNTVDLYGSATIASGLVAVPVNPDCDSIPLALYDHGTVLLKTDVPSSDNTEAIIGKAIASKGYVVAMPDYLGLGIQTGNFHPYQHAESEATSSVDLLRATKEFIEDSLSFDFSNEIFITGYSQGGHSAMATAKYIHDNQLMGELPVAGIAPLSGAYHASERQMAQLLNNVPYGTPGYIVYLLFSYQTAYGNIFANYSDILQSPYDTIVPPLFDGTHTIGEVHAVLPTLTSLYLDSVFLNSIILDSVTQTTPIWQAMLDNDNYDWTPSVPIKMLYCNADEQVNPLNTMDAYDAMVLNGVTNITAEDLGALSHGDCVIPAITNTIDFFQSLRTDCKIPSGIDSAPKQTTELSIFPTPTRNEINISTSNEINGFFHIYNIKGQIVKSGKFNSNQSIDISDLMNSTYILSLESETTLYYARITKIK